MLVADQMARREMTELEPEMSAPPPGNEKAPKPRHRASVACVSCRERRTRCVVQNGEKSCTQCIDNGQECVIKNDDLRRK